MTTQQIARRRIVRVKNDIRFLIFIKKHAKQGYTCGLSTAARFFHEGNIFELMKMLRREQIIKRLGPLKKIRDPRIQGACLDGNPLMEKCAAQSSPMAWKVDMGKLHSFLAKKNNELSRLEEEVTQGVSL